jgi:hypothetical protein
MQDCGFLADSAESLSQSRVIELRPLPDKSCSRKVALLRFSVSIRPYQELSPPHSTMVWIDGYCDDHNRDSYEEKDVQA